MNIETKNILIQKFKAGALSAKENQMLEQYLESGEIELEDLESLHTLYKKIELEDTEVPTIQMRETFYQNLEKEKMTLANDEDTLGIVSNWWSNIFSQKINWSFGLALLLGGILLGNFLQPDNSQEISNLSTELQETRETMMSALIDKRSSNERLKAVHISQEMEGVSSKVIDMLLTTLNQDENVNVRLAAIDALSNYADLPNVREGLIKSIKNQDSHIVQLTLADLMVFLQDKRSVEEFQDLMNQKEIPTEIKNELKEKMDILL